MIIEAYFFTTGDKSLNGPYKTKEEALLMEEAYERFLKIEITKEDQLKIQAIHQQNTKLRNQIHSCTA